MPTPLPSRASINRLWLLSVLVPMVGYTLAFTLVPPHALAPLDVLRFLVVVIPLAVVAGWCWLEAQRRYNLRKNATSGQRLTEAEALRKRAEARLDQRGH